MTDAPLSTDPLASATLVYVAPRTGTSGVSDYADDMIAEARRVVGTVVEVRHGGAGQDSLRDVVRGRRAIKRAIRAASGPVILHTEQSGGVLLPFWGLIGQRPSLASSTLHDAPLGVWLPFRIRLVSSNRIAVHALHYPIMPLLQKLEERVVKRVSLTALTASGASEIERILKHDPVGVQFLPAPPKNEVTPAPERPLAVGLFGYVYKGKGFEQLSTLRDLIDPAIDIRVAGRGTAELPPIPGVTILGAVEDEEEDAFFASIRALVIPYSKRSSYGPETHVASSAIARAIAYRTPVIALGHPGLGDEAEVVDGGLEALAARINELVPSAESMERITARSSRLKDELTRAAAFARLAERWRSSGSVSR